MSRSSRLGAASLAWLPALLVLLIPAWLLLRGAESDDAFARLASPGTVELLLRSLALAAAVAVGCTLVAVPLAFLTARTDLPGRRLWAILLALPLAMPSYVGAFALIGALGHGGLITRLFGGAAMPDLHGFTGATLALVLLGYPYVFVPVRAAFAEADPRLEQSARTLGATPLGAFRRVSLPLAWPAVVAGALLVALYALSDFGAVSMLQLDTFTRVIYLQHSSFDRGGAAALALVLVALTALILLAELALRRRGGRFASRSGARRGGPPLIPLGRWRWPALLLVTLVVGVALVMPVAVVVAWAAEGGNVCEYCAPIGELAGHSILVAAATAGVAMLLVLAVARAATRGRGWFSRAPDRIVYAGFAVPGMVVALALVFVGTRWVPGLYQTVPLLVLACVIRFIPQAADPLRPAMARVPASLEEAARTLGAKPPAAFRRVTMPIVAGSWLAGGALVFLTTVKELPATLVMRPTGWDTLATELWDLTNEGFFGEAAWRALALLGVGVVPMVILWLWTERGRRT